ncbi:IPP transferase-domain-containing protein [Scleroderma yunnanense]
MTSPVIAICGTTGVGKSKLGIELALRLAQVQRHENPSHKWRGARIINADSMQVYTGMNVITNKVPFEERMGVEHLLMDFKRPGEQYVVGQWVQDAIEAIQETHSRHEIPIIVGGTSYWIQHLLFPNRLSSGDSINVRPGEQRSIHPRSSILKSRISQLPPHLLELLNSLPEQPSSAVSHPDDALLLHQLLQTLDEPVAARWHWRDTRKVLRSLQIIKEHGRIPSEIISEQATTAHLPRYHTLCFWLYAEPSALNPRLDNRVDDMIRGGLVDEIRELYKIARSSTAPQTYLGGGFESKEPVTDYTLGIYQCIGYKEFREFLTDPNTSQEAFTRAIEQMKHSTRKYAKRQVSWLRNKLLPAIQSVTAESQLMASMYLLDATVLGDAWDLNVSQPAQAIMDAFLNSSELPDPATLSPLAQAMLVTVNKPVNPTAVLEARRKMVCSICTTDPSRPVMVEEGIEWEVHQKTRLHRRLSSKLNKGQSRDAPGDRLEQTRETDEESGNTSFFLPSFVKDG